MHYNMFPAPWCGNSDPGGSIEDFEQLVIEAIDSLPEEFIKRLDNVDITVESMPTRAQLAQQGIPDDSLLLGLYEGVPMTARQGGLVMNSR